MGFAHPDATDFIFTYTDTIGRIKQYNYKLSPEIEGTMVLFPSDFNHAVYPGWTKPKGYRISVSGDISLSSLRVGDSLV